MKTESAFVFAQSAAMENWEEEDKSSYDAAALETEYRNRLYSDKGRDLLNSFEAQSASAASSKKY